MTYYITKMKTLGTPEESLLYIKDNAIIPELKVDMPSVLSPAQYDFAYNHMVTYIVDLFTYLVDDVFVSFGWDATTLQLATYIGMIVSFRVSAYVFMITSAVIVFLSAMLYGRYRFHAEWKSAKVVEVSSTRFAVFYQSKVILPMLLFVYLASPIPLYNTYAMILSAWAGLVGYNMARSFTDHI